MNHREFKSWTDDELDLSIRAIYLKNVLVDWEDGAGEQPTDATFWFASIPADDCWYAFGMSDTFDNPEEMIFGALQQPDNSLLEFKRLATWLGFPWSWITQSGQCPHCIAVYQRDAKVHVPRDDLNDSSIEELKALRGNGEWLGWIDRMEVLGGITLSPN